MYSNKKVIENISKEEIQEWLNSPITKELNHIVEEYNKDCNGAQSIFIGVQYSDNKAVVHFGITQ